MSRTLVAVPTGTAPSGVLLWGTCPVCLTEHYTLTTTGHMPPHPVPGYGPNRPQCTGSHKQPKPDTVEPARTCFNASGNYGVIQWGAAA